MEREREPLWPLVTHKLGHQRSQVAPLDHGLAPLLSIIGKGNKVDGVV